jgi:hypothetical protein
MSDWSRIILVVAMSAGSSGCIAHQRAHSIVRCWADCNTYNQCAVCFEQLDHKPLRAARVGSFVWMYDQDPGHQNAFAKARLEWEALIAHRLNDATEAANQGGAVISGMEADTTAIVPPAPESSSPADIDLPPLPDQGADDDRPSPSPPVPNFDQEPVHIGPEPGPNASSQPTRIQSPQRLPANLPEQPPGISVDFPSSGGESAYRLSGHTQPVRDGEVNAPSRPRERRVPHGAWLFSRP